MLVTDQPSRATILVEINLAIGAYCVYQGRKKIRNQDAVSRFHIFNRRSDAIGAADEVAAQAEVRKTLYWLCGNEFYLHDSPLVIEHAPGTDYPTAEMDHLAATPYGIFIFETKH
ncbi:nuclease-related domain-containing protein [Caballeronia sp. LZ035]|uniref:nuclease-related domain-containing protein n=1 Tax=Caballeronia sp. LZ035 TaxID=3038568 RepID=UPI002858835C|nr:nuclease-related domain-containing protein [Caballeronia sp. LZ035]MDR5762998.1 nuclease-related domain-containing protein [Caballeronia sp. LZ035]